MKTSFEIDKNNLEKILRAAHKISKPIIIGKTDSIKDAIELVIYSLNLSSNISVYEVADLYIGYSVTIESGLAMTTPLFLKSVEILTKHLTLERPHIDETIEAIDIVNIVKTYYIINGLYRIYSGKPSPLVGITDKDENSINIVNKSPRFFTFLKKVGKEKALNAYQILLTKGFSGIDLEEGENFYSFHK